MSDEKFGYLEARNDKQYFVFEGDSEPELRADHLDYIVDVYLEVYGHPSALSPIEEDWVFEGRDNRKEKVADLSGYLVLGNQADKDGFSLLDVCDEHSYDLHYASQILDKAGILDQMNWNFFYLHNLKLMQEKTQLREQLLKWLPTLVFRFAHVRPDFTVYYPRSLPYEKAENKGKDLMETLMQEQAAKQIEKILSGDKLPKAKNEFEVDYRVPEQVYSFFAEKDGTAPYPETAKDTDEFNAFERVGFKEIGDSRLLFQSYTDIDL